MYFNQNDLDFEQVTQRFAELGIVVIRGVLPCSDLLGVQEQWQKMRNPLREGSEFDGMKRIKFYVHGKLKGAIGSTYKHPNVVAIAQKLLGPDVALYLSRLNIKDDLFQDLIHLHQDMPYFSGGTNKLNFFVALQDVNLNNGAMVFVPGSHRLPIQDRKTIDLAKHPEFDVVIPTLCAGDLVVADIRLWHSSVPNSVGTDRVLLQMIFQPATDGSYYPQNCPQPTLVAGAWRTDQFPPWTRTVGLSAATTAASTAPQPPVIPVVHAKEALTKRIARRLVPIWARNMARNALARYRKSLNEPATPVVKRELPTFFTPSTGPAQVWPLPDHMVDWATAIRPTAEYLCAARKIRVVLGVREMPASKVLRSAAALGLDVVGYLHIKHPGETALKPGDGKPVHAPDDLRTLSGVDAVVMLSSRDFGLAARHCEQYLREDLLFVPGACEAVVPVPVRNATPSEWTERSSILGYLQNSGLRGHFAEFGTFWGRAFFASYFELNQWLQGRFFAFDSFAGLSDADPLETKFTGGAFKKGAFGFSHGSFKAIAGILGIPADRIVTVPGFFDKTLSPELARRLDIAPKSVSVCRIDCDLFKPTYSVLQFIAPLLDDGALIYFDDWRLCRADSRIGERGAAIRWLNENTSFELVPYPSTHWQHQWFIFHRDKLADSTAPGSLAQAA